MSHLPIAEYALLSDCHSAALVSRAGSVDWLCFPRFDSPSTFARLLDPAAGHWSVSVEGARVSRRYVDGTLVLETTFETEAGTAVLRDALAMGPGDREHRLGAGAPHALLREVRGVRGRVELEACLAPRPEYGLVTPLLLPRERGLHVHAAASVLWLDSPGGWRVEAGTGRLRASLREGESLAFALRWGRLEDPDPEPWTAERIHERLEDTLGAWRSWSELHQGYQGPWKEQVHQSGRILQGLTYYPTGARVAAPTTSLPEVPGGDRNWDYRYCWIRDASFTLGALWVAACPEEAQKFFRFLSHAAFPQLRGDRHVQVVFGVGGEHDLTEREIPWLAGWRGSCPVRVGNGAWDQRQLDVYGELLDAVHRLRDQLHGMEESTRDFLRGAADAAARRWREKDQGIWEERGEPRDFLYSKLMCWVALDRAIDLAEALRAGDRVEDWKEERERIRAAILEHGWSERANAFTVAFDSDEIDASALVIPIVGFLPAADPRVRATVQAVRERLGGEHGFVYRKPPQDGEGEREGAFLLCTFWLAEAQALAGDVEAARATFERAAGCANDLGLLAEEVDPGSGALLGNFPQAFSHVGLVNAAWAIHRAEGGAALDPASP